jgi:protein gp37
MTTKNESLISWTTLTWNPIHGCSKVSEGCDFCYAETLSLRRGHTPLPWLKENEEQNVILKPHKLVDPFGWEPSMVFVNSMSDLFHEGVPDEYVAQIFAVMAATPQHTYQVLTKRPGRMASLMTSGPFIELVEAALPTMVNERLRRRAGYTLPFDGPGRTEWPLSNVWLGTSVENQRWADVRIPKLLQTPAEVRFLSCEPLLGRVDLEEYLGPYGHGLSREEAIAQARGILGPATPLTVDWVIVGGESGLHLAGAGPEHERWMDMAWAREIRDRCVAAGVPFFFKQDAGVRTEMRPWLVEEDGSRWEWHQFPGELRPPRPL